MWYRSITSKIKIPPVALLVKPKFFNSPLKNIKTFLALASTYQLPYL
jgi:hypothetical protein